MRQRMIKSEFFSSESMAGCSFGARLCFIGLWCCAKDDGNVVFAPRSLKKDIFGMDDVTMAEFFGYLKELEEVGCIRPYKTRGKAYINIPNFLAYQTINRPQKSNLPAYSVNNHCSFSEWSVNEQGTLTPNQSINQSIKAGTGGGDDAAPIPFDDWKRDYETGKED